LAENNKICYNLAMNISLTPELERWIQQKVETGHYQTLSEVVREALRTQIEREQQRNQLREMIEEGWADVELGKTISLNELEKRVKRQA
jgi:antitoxin ParD1/3/4